MRRASLVLVAALAAVAAAAAPAPAADASHRPVIFVHGYNADPGVWGAMASDFKAAGYADGEIFSWGYDTHQSTNEVLAAQFAAYVDGVREQTGSAQVDIVAHSLGSLPSRWYVKQDGGADKVAHWVSLGGPNHGTSTAWACAAWDQACRDMTPGSYVITQLSSGDETPGPTAYATYYSSCDEVINPDDSVPIDGATNTDAGCLGHNDLLTDDAVAGGVLGFLGS